MKTVVFFVLFSVSINFAYTNSIKVVNDAAPIEVPNDSENDLLPSDGEVVENDSGVEIYSLRQCSPGQCSAHCLGLGHARGGCFENYCQCQRSSPSTVELNSENAMEIEPSNRLGCTMLSCMDLCRRLGFRYFQCINLNTCRCWN